jgi:hypothetical protein
MRHTRTLLDTSVGRVLPSAAAFSSPPPKPTPAQLAAWRRRVLLQQQEEQRQAQRGRAPRATDCTDDKRAVAPPPHAGGADDCGWQHAELRHRALHSISHAAVTRAMQASSSARAGLASLLEGMKGL